MKKFFAAVVAFVALNTATAQQQNESGETQHKIDESSFLKKGKIFVFYGWNRSWYGNSDINFSGNGYQFQLNGVHATDRPSPFGWDYVNPAWFTVTQYDFRIGYFLRKDLALVLGIDHMKYVMKQDQTVGFSGTISDPHYAAMVQNGQVDLSNSEFLTFEHTDGLNYENIGIEKYKSLINHKNLELVWSYGAGLGFMFPKSNVKLFGNERSDRFHVAGMGTDARASLNLILAKHWMVRLEGKAGYINMWDIKTTLNNKPDKARQDFVFGQVLAGIGYTFNTKK